MDDKSIHEDIEHLKFWVWLLIYQRKNETFFLRKSFIWRQEAMITMFCWMLFSFEITAKFLCWAYNLWSISIAINSQSQKYFHFLFVYARFWYARAGSNCVNFNYEAWTKLFNKKFQQVKITTTCNIPNLIHNLIATGT